MPRVYRRKCNYCGNKYKGGGKYFCSVNCSRKGQKRSGIKKGSIAWNKGTKGVMKANKTSFKKGEAGYWLGRKRSKETIEKMSKGRKGIKHTEEAKKKIREACKGDKCYNWKGGITPILMQIRHCLEYRQWRSDVFTRDDFTCQKCLIRGGKLEAHHIKEFSVIVHENSIKSIEEARDCEELWNINNGQTLCVDCHKKTENYKGKANKNIQYTA